MNTQYMNTLSEWTLVGFLDSDGHFFQRITKRKNNKIGMSTGIQFTQKTANDIILQQIKNQLNSKTQIRGGLKTYKSEKSIGFSMFDVFFNTPAGATFIKILEKKPPLSPSKYREYLISCKLLEFQQNNYIYKEIESLPFPKQVQEKISSVATCHLVFDVMGSLDLQIQKQKQDKLNNWIDHLQPETSELNQGVAFASEWLIGVQNKVSKHSNFLTKQNVCLPKDYIVGFFIGDGCLSFSINFRKNTKKIRLAVHPFFYLDDIAQNIHLLEAIKSTLKTGALTNETGGRYRYKATTWNSVWKVLEYLLNNKNLPSFRQEQFSKFRKAFYLGLQGRIYCLNGFLIFLDIVYDMNRGGSLRRKTKQQLIEEAIEYFQQPNRQSYKNLVKKRRKEIHLFFQNLNTSSKPYSLQYAKWVSKIQ